MTLNFTLTLILNINLSLTLTVITGLTLTLSLSQPFHIVPISPHLANFQAEVQNHLWRMGRAAGTGFCPLVYYLCVCNVAVM